MRLLPSDSVTTSFRWCRRHLVMGNHHSGDGGKPPASLEDSSCTADDVTAGDGRFGLKCSPKHYAKASAVTASSSTPLEKMSLSTSPKKTLLLPFVSPSCQAKPSFSPAGQQPNSSSPQRTLSPKKCFVFFQLASQECLSLRSQRLTSLQPKTQKSSLHSSFLISLN